MATSSPKPAKDDPVRNLTPSFSKTPPETYPAPETDPNQLTSLPEKSPLRLVGGPGDEPPGPSEPRPARLAVSSRTGTSTAGDEPAPVKPATVADATALVVGLLGVAVAVAGGLIRWRMRRQLREPTATQAQRMAAPIARMTLRRVDLAQWGEDVADVLALAGAGGAYLADGPLLGPLHDVIDEGIPQEEN